MTLPKDYTSYPKRKHGQDHERYQWNPVAQREKTSLKGGQSVGVAIIVPLEYFMLNPSGKPFKHPGAMVTPYPDLRHYTTRDYGNRVGVFRLLKAFKDAGVKATFAVNAVLLDRVRPLIDDIIADGHEIAAHGFDTDSIHWGAADPDAEKRYVEDARASFDKAGISPRSWMSPARQQGFKTLDLIRGAGFDICLDWELDRVPVFMKTDAGEIDAFPVLNELDDRFLLITKHQPEDVWRDQILEAAAMMKSETPQYGASAFGFTMTPYIAGLPYRMWAVRDILSALAADQDILLDTVSSITDAFK